MCVLVLLRSLYLVVLRGLGVLVDYGSFVFLLDDALNLNLLLRFGGLGGGLLCGDSSSDWDAMEIGCFWVSGVLVGGLSLCGSHWDCFSS